MSGDFSLMFDDGEGATLSLEEDGVGTMTFAGESADVTWKQDGEKLTVTTSEGKDLDGTFKDGVIVLTMADDDFTGTLIFTVDGTYDKAREISLAAAKDITSESELIGTWSLSGMNMMGMTIYGEAASLASMAGETDVTVSFEEGGACTLMGEEATWSIGSDGAVITTDGASIPVKALGDDIVIDVAGATGDLDFGDDLLFLFSR